MLKLDNIHTFYGESHIIQGVSLDVQEKECVSYLGRNGAGKSTTLRSIMGLNAPREGKIIYKESDITGKKPFEIVRGGIAYVPENRQIFSSLTVMENLMLSVQKKNVRRNWDIEKIFDFFPSLEKRKNHRGNELSGGEQQMLAIGRSLMTNPEFLLLDEPTEGLSPLIVKVVLQIIERIKEKGITILLVEQNVDAILDITDRFYILEQGRIVYHGSGDEFRGNYDIREKYLGV
ncbi:MAG: ABC transporter ATP-binding protein [Smithella sp.]|nr:ABC transporter ATP-binding protein [Smithella sp.]